MFWPFRFRKWATRGVSVKPEIIRFELESRGVPDVPLADGKYRAISHKDFQELVATYRRKYGPYKMNVRDCDKFTTFYLADIMWGWAECSKGDESLAFGFMEGQIKKPNREIGGHRWIWQRDDKGVYWYINAEDNSPMDWEILEFYGARG